MIKNTLLLGLFAVLLLNSCKGVQQNLDNSLLNNTTVVPYQYYALINQDSIATNLKKLASDEFQGRRTGEPGQKKATEFIVNFYKKRGIAPPKEMDGYLQSIPSSFMKPSMMKLQDSENILAYFEGTEKPEEVLIISAHYDHMGILLDQIYYGADDNGSGTASIMEIARVFQQLKEQGIQPKRSVLFIHLTGEEFGLFGSKYYVQNPIFPIENTIANLNIDMIGRRSKEHSGKGDYIFAVGSGKLSKDLYDVVSSANKESINLTIDYKFDDENDPQQIYYRSDHYSFAQKGIPAVFYYNGTHDDYHLPSDTFDKIDLPLLTKRTQLIFTTAWKLANGEHRPQLTEKKN
ncbi:M28 family metallopeptidase [Myroides sp. LoEW2-1]|uniref:M28 family metallopeptidase n=1 Tax=Myroides sp. LoEW2-1 TaxID=2683192 RepID=UPI0013280B6F|nr:M28 family metallopeptidase [Myroides sp. LoEW2-1]MVX36077.1 M28 family peptidase [Myroides sp. LoEW2-1]